MSPRALQSLARRGVRVPLHEANSSTSAEAWRDDWIGPARGVRVGQSGRGHADLWVQSVLLLLPLTLGCILMQLRLQRPVFMVLTLAAFLAQLGLAAGMIWEVASAERRHREGRRALSEARAKTPERVRLLHGHAVLLWARLLGGHLTVPERDRLRVRVPPGVPQDIEDQVSAA